MNIEIRPFVPDDYDAAVALWEACEWVGLGGRDSLERIHAFLARNPGMSCVATADGAVVGAVLCGHDGRRGYIHHLGVDEKWRRRGIGRRLVERCLDGLQKEGIDKCHLFIFSDNRAGIEFWKSVGWTPRDEIYVMSMSIKS